MCGELDEEDHSKGDLCHRFVERANAVLARSPAPATGHGESDLNAYLDKLFVDVLRRIVRDLLAVDARQACDRVAMQSLVLGRLAGFIAGHAPLKEDPLRKLIEATMLGYGEADVPRIVHDHDHHHDHHHHHH